MPRTAEAALETLTADGWCPIGSLLDVRSYNLSSDVLFHVDRGEVRFERVP